jgi:hypothetical protein
MNGKFVMEITVPQLQHPLLYERLRACATARERAAVFRALAEAHLRGESSGAYHGLRPSEPARPQADASPPLSGSDAATSEAGDFDAVRVEDSDTSGSVFGSYLEDLPFN